MFERFIAMNLVMLHADEDAAHSRSTAHARDIDAITVAPNDDEAALNERIRSRIERGEVDDTVTVACGEGLSIGAGEFVQTRRNGAFWRISSNGSCSTQGSMPAHRLCPQMRVKRRRVCMRADGGLIHTRWRRPALVRWNDVNGWLEAGTPQTWSS